MKNNIPKIAIIFAGGVGQRMNNAPDSIPKQFLKINDKPIIIRTLELFQNHKQIDKIYVSIHQDYYNYMQKLSKYYYLTKVAGIVKGGKTGQDSIYKALKLAEKENPPDSIVLIHDGVRPNITESVITNNIESVIKNGNSITCTSCFETVLISSNHLNPTTIPYRKDTFTAQAPQSFRLKDVINAHETVRKTNPDYKDITDTCTLYKSLGKDVFMTDGNRGNIKITTMEDLYLLRGLIRFKEDMEAFGYTHEI